MGCRVHQHQPGSLAEDAGIRAVDLLLAVDKRHVDAVTNFDKALRALTVAVLAATNQG